MGLFSILFGAGIILMTSRVEQKGYNSAALYYRRTLWLLIFGLVHGYIFWSGDILFSYAVCGLILYFCRKTKPKQLLISGLIILSVASLLYILSGLSMPMWPPESIQETIQRAREMLDKVSPEDKEDIINLIERINDAITEEEMEEALKAQEELEELLFYLE